MRSKGRHIYPKEPRQRRGRMTRLGQLIAVGAIVSLLTPAVALASDWSVAVVDVTSPPNSVTLAPGGSDNVNI
jgi:hypothetical protein